MARDRKRARPRRGRSQVGQPASGGAAAPADAGLHRGDLPGALDHASAEVDEFDAALVRGAGGVPAPVEATSLVPGEGASNGAPAATEVLPATGGDGRPPDRSGGVALQEDEGGGEDGGGTATVERAERREPRRSLPARAAAFLRASWAELQRVQWPDRPQVSQATAVVLGFVAVAGLYLGAADWVAQKIVNFIL